MAGSWADMTLPDFFKWFFHVKFPPQITYYKESTFLACSCSGNKWYKWSKLWLKSTELFKVFFFFFKFVKIRFIFYLFRFVLSFLFQLVLTTRQTCFHLCNGFQKWYPHTARKNGLWYLNLTGHLYSSGGKVGFLKWPQFCKFLI